MKRAYIKVVRLCMYFSIATRQNTAEHFKDLPGWLDGSTVLVRAEFKLYSLSPNPKFKIRTTLTREIILFYILLRMHHLLQMY